MKRLFTFFVLLFLFFLPNKLHSENIAVDKYTISFNACSSCSHQVGNTKFFDDGGENGIVSNKHTVTTFIANPGFVLSLYFTEIDLPNGAKIKVYSGDKVDDENLVKTFYQIEKTKNINGEKLTVEYIPSQNYNNSKGWIAHIDELIPKPDNTALRMLSPPESDCPYAIPLCQNNTAVALGGQYTDLGNIYDDEGSCYSGTGNGGSVWYSFSPQSSGPLDFMITPQGSTDYDFVLWDITNGCQSNKRNELACNFSLYTGTTGMNSTLCTENYGSCSSNDCSNQSKGSDCNRFNNRINVTVGRQYAICVNFYGGSNDGFLIEFKKQASSVAITDVVPPVVSNAYSGNCSNATNFHVLFSEWVSCATIQNTDFTLAGHTFTIVNTNCVNGRTNNIDISVSPALTTGSYSVHVQDIYDLCNNNMNSNFNISLGAPPTPTMTNPQIVCRTPGLFGSFNYSPSSQTITAGGGTAYYWNDGQIGAAAIFSPTSNTTISVTVVNGSCSANISKTITVEATAVSLGLDQLYCGTPLTLTALPAIAGSTYTFYRNPVVFPPSNGTQFQTGASNTTTVSPAGYTVYRVVVTSPNGCKAQDDMVVTTNPPVNATISLNGNNFCLGANPLVLTATPVGGTFSGLGVSNDTFYPAIAGVGNDTVRYSVTNGCGTFTGIRVIKVIAGTLPTVNLNPTYCVSDADVTLNPNPKCGQFFGPGITTAGSCLFGAWIANPVFSPSTAGIGNHTLTYTGSGCANTFKVQVLGAGAAPIISGAGGPYCSSATSITLTGSPTGGTFSGPGMTGSTFNPATAGVGTHTITYTVFACGNALTNTKQIQVVSGSGSATISYSPNTFCNAITTSQNVTITGTSGGTYSASPAGLSINAATGAITPNTSTINSYTVTYTIPASGGCSQFTTTAPVTISSGITPTFTAINPICQNATPPTLPTTSNNLITGAWSPTTTINTSIVGTTTYTFTPNSGQCASNKTMDITIASVKTTNLTQAICNGNSIVFNGNTISTAGVYRDTLTTSLGCDSFIVLTATIKTSPTTNITQAICNGSSITFNGNTITTAGVYRDTLTTSLGCDSFIVLTVSITSSPTTNITQAICNGSFITFNGNTITTAGVYRDTLTTSLGCDSFIVLTTTIKTSPTTNIIQAICNGNSIVFNGNTISTAGVYRDTLTTSLGCDSFIVLTTTIKTSPTTNITQAICNGSSITFNGNTISTAGVYRDTLTTSLGCDSFIVLTATIKTSPTTNITQAICNGSSITFNGNTITTAGVYRDTLTTSLGCDSFIVLTTTITSSPNTNITQAICNGSSITFNGNTITTAGVYRDTLTTSLGCDSFIVLTTTIKSSPTTNITQVICNGNSITFNGNTITTAGVYRDTLTTSLGCDSFIVLTTTITSSPTTNITQAICNGSSITFNGNTITTAGVYRDTLTTSLGCDSFIVLTTTIKTSPTTNITQAICNGSFITFNGNTITTAGVYRDTLTTSLGCDSFIVLTTTIKSSPTTNLTQAICNGNTIIFNGNTITTAGVYRDTLTTSLGCDSFIVLTTTIKTSPTTNITQAICNGSFITFNGNTITTAGVYRDTLTTSLGCDSFIVLTTTIKSSPTTNITQAICNGSSITFNGNTITTAGVYRDTLTTSLGCDSFIVLTTTIKSSPTTNLTQAICNGSFITFNGNTITTAGVYRDTLTTSLGCDSFIVLTTTIKSSPTTNLTQAICNGNTIIFNGNTITTAGVYRDTLTTSLGCDSFIVLTTTIKSSPTTNLTQAICNGNTIIFNGNTISTAGVYRDTLTTSLGCDSFIVLTVSITSSPTTNLTQAICNGSAITFNGNTITTAGVYRDTLTTSLGCDSFIVLTVSIKSSPTTNLTQAICNGSFITFNGNTITTAGVYRDTLTTSLGCDSFIVLTVSITSSPPTNITQAICNGSSITFNGNTISTAGVYRDTLTTSLGCDSFIVLTVSITSSPTTNITQAICNGSSITFNGNTISTAGVYRDTLTTSLGCDSFIVLTVSITSSPTTNITQAICNGSSITFNGNTISTAGVYRDTLTTSLGCDSFIVLTATIKTSPTTNITQAICNGSSITFNGNTITTAGVYRDTLTTSLGCDSFIVLTTTIKSSPTTNITQAICNGNSIVFNGNTISTAGVYRDTLTTSLGCDSFIVLTTTIKSSPTTNITQAICNGNSIVFNGNTITTAGVYRDTLTTSLGCDSFIVLTTTIKTSPTTNITQAICNGNSITFNGNTITTAGVYRDTLSTSLGCDSFIALTVTVKPKPTTNIVQSICQGSSIAFNGLNITTSGVYRDTLTTSLGCDSFILFTVKVNPRPTTNISRAICQGNSTAFNGQTITTAGTFRDTLTTSLGCDSFIVLTVNINPIKRTTQNLIVCQGNSVTVGTHIYTTTGNYVDTLQSSQNCDSIVSTNLTVNPNFSQSVTIVSDTNNICDGQLVRFTATAQNTGANLIYQWYLNGIQVGTNNAVFTSSTLHDNDAISVQIKSNATCLLNSIASSNTIRIHVDTIGFSIPKVEYCYGQNSIVNLHISPTNYSVFWKNGNDTFTTNNIDSIVVNNTTTSNLAFIIRFGNGCSKSGEVPIIVNPLPVIDATVDIPKAKYQQEVQLGVSHSGTLSYNWLPATSSVNNDSIRNPTSIIKATTLFSVQVKDKNNCTTTDTILVELIDECRDNFIFIPTAFSPNNDGVNDCFGILSPPVLSEFKMVIFDRWNEKIFEANDVNECWNGTYKGAESLVDSYIYIISFRCYNVKILSKKGTVTLLK